METIIQWHTVESWMAYTGLIKNGVCQIYLKFAYHSILKFKDLN